MIFFTTSYPSIGSSFQITYYSSLTTTDFISAAGLSRINCYNNNFLSYSSAGIGVGIYHYVHICTLSVMQSYILLVNYNYSCVNVHKTTEKFYCKFKKQICFPKVINIYSIFLSVVDMNFFKLKKKFFFKIFTSRTELSSSSICSNRDQVHMYPLFL